MHIRRYQQGGALVECSILCTLLLPVIFLLIFMGDIIGIRQTTIQASRYLAWEQTVNPGYRAPTDIKPRFYEQTRDSSVSFEAGGGYYLDVNAGGDSVASRFGKNIQKSGAALEYLHTVDWKIEGDGLVNAGVQVNVLNHPKSLNAGRACNGEHLARLFGCVSARNTIMVDGWGVASNDLAERRTRALVPAAAMATTGKALSLAGKIPFLNEFRGLENAFGAVDTTVLPLDRYTGSYTVAHQ